MSIIPKHAQIGTNKIFAIIITVQNIAWMRQNKKNNGKIPYSVVQFCILNINKVRKIGL